MPYQSRAQQRFFHTDTAKRSGISSIDVAEYDRASKGKRLPERVTKRRVRSRRR